jgi:hypothetical protein
VRVPRVRFTMRWMMGAVVLIAAALASLRWWRSGPVLDVFVVNRTDAPVSDVHLVYMTERETGGGPRGRLAPGGFSHLDIRSPRHLNLRVDYLSPDGTRIVRGEGPEIPIMGTSLHGRIRRQSAGAGEGARTGAWTRIL